MDLHKIKNCIDCGKEKPNVYAKRCRKCNDVLNTGKGNNNYRHGLTRTPIYRSWRHMIERCINKNDSAYKYYGGRGISVCKKWLDFIGFKDDMYKSYLKHKENNKSTTIERIDVNGNYCKENCKWIINEEQGKNKTNTVYINNKTISEWSKITGLKYSTIYRRYRKKLPINKIISKKLYE